MFGNLSMHGKLQGLPRLRLPSLNLVAVSILLAFQLIAPGFALSSESQDELPALTPEEVSGKTVESFVWSALPFASPDARNLHTLTFAQGMSKAILFGGWNGSTLLDDVWSLDPVSGAWKRLFCGGAIPGRRSHGTIYDPDSNRVIVFGGFRGTYLNDVWALDLNSQSWRELLPSGTLPPARSNHAVVYDTERKRLITFGGFGGTILGNVWALDLGSLTWKKLVATGDAPPPLFGCSAVWDPLEGRVLVFGGDDGTSPGNDIWSLDTETLSWHRIIARGTLPEARSTHTAIFDLVHGKMLVAGGFGSWYLNDVWSFDVKRLTWQEISPSPLPMCADAAFVYDPLREQALLFGGWNGAFLDDTWKLDLNNLTWSQVFPSASFPTARRGASFVRNEEGKRIFMFGGFDGTTYFDELWKFNLEDLSWELLIPSGTPPSGRERHAVLLDRNRNRMVVQGGYDGATYLDDIWILDLSTYAWRELAQTARPSGRAGHTLVYDNLTGSFVLFGGEDGAGFLGDLSVGWPSEYEITWESKTQTLPYPGARTGQFGTYVPSTNSVLIFGGRDGMRLFNDLWSLNMANFTWHQITSSGSVPPKRSGHAGALTESENELLVFGGWAGAHVNDLWSFDIQNETWSEVGASGDIPPGSEFVSFVSDTSARRCYLFGGFNGWFLGDGYMLYQFSPSPTPLYPADGSKIGSRAPSLTVLNSPSDGKTLAYFFELDAVSEFDSPQVLKSPGIYQGLFGRTSWTVSSPLSYNATYYFRVRSYDGASFSGWTAPIRFSVVTSDTTLSPTTPRPAGPTELSIVYQTFPDLRVLNSRDSEDSIISYFFELDATDEFSTPLLQVSPGMAQGLLQTSWKVEKRLTRNGWYYWRARAFDGEYFSDWMDPTRFLVFWGATPAPDVSFFSNRNRNGIELSWDPKSFPQGTSFDVYRSESEAGEFTKLSSVSVRGSSTGERLSFLDGAPLSSQSFYLLLVKNPSGELSLYGPVAESPVRYVDSLELSPSPFSETVTITFAVSKETRASVRIYDVRGRLVKTVLDEKLSPSSKSVTWDGRDASGVRVGSGIYICSLKTDNVSLSRKLVFVR
ncbi:MAG: kelch repeat-containing protein [Candidatus Eisenbacteria bacterium]|nr:kelch repeat-containing protein [Candidatus Eisenbacteria bacterium]